MAKAQNQTVPINVGVVLIMNNSFGKMGLSCISMALSDFYASNSHYRTRLVLHTRDAKGDDVGAAAAALDLLKNVEVKAIIGPPYSMQANFLIDLGDKAQVPIISFSTTSPSLSSIRSPYFIRATQKDSSQVNAITAIIQAFGWREVVPIYVDNEFGEGIIPFLTDALEKVNARVPYRSAIPSMATDDQIVAELYKLMTMQTRVFIVHVLTSLGSRLFTKAKQLGMMSEDYAWIITDGITNELNSMDPSVIEFMLSVIGVKPYVPKTKELRKFMTRWQQNNPTINPELNIFGLWAYDSATALAMAVEKARLTNVKFQMSIVSRNATDLERFGISKYGPELLQALSNITLKGLAGNFQLLDGQLQSSPYEIVNLVGHGARAVGFWTKETGILKELNSSNTKTYSTSKNKFGSVIWPGDKTSPPKGWVIPTNGKKLRIGVPVKIGFTEFLQVTWDSDSNSTEVKGYCRDVFDAIMAALPYGVPYEYIPFATPDHKSAGSYNDLVYQVYLGNYDAVVGDVTIVANRSQYVDFTLPYTESGVSMMMPIKKNKGKNAWVFLKPLSWELWLTSFCSFVFIGFLIWLLEHRINEDFRGPPLHQVGMIFWFAFSTMVFAHKEKIISNLARFVLIIWFLVVLILTQSYTASLTSMLTVQQLQPTITDINQLLKNKEYVGYLQGSFVFGLLKQMNFDESRLVQYNSPEECDELFSKGSGNGGIAAAFDEIPYMKLFLANYCSKYTMVDPTYKTGGFSFVFPIGSPLVPDVSRAILNVTEGEKMVEIERAWFGEKTKCPDSSTSLSSNNIGLESFWGLFLIAGIAAVSALIIYVIMFLHEHWNVLRCSDPNSSLRSKVVELFRRFDNKDLSSHTFRNTGLRERNICDGDCMERVEKVSSHGNFPQTPQNFSLNTSPHTNFPPSPTFSNCTEQYLNSPQEQMNTMENVMINSQAEAAHVIEPEIELVNPNQDSQMTARSTSEIH
ncbi:Glutamate receptor 2.7 [Forsythia ovata]|uniref:Glutamate receptor n=1 Tax=Forsythia ovata TaxID=205694 RepID=A0ABD1WEQ5_9LAMI